MNVKHLTKKIIFGLMTLTTLNAMAAPIEVDLGRGVLSYDLSSGVKDRCITLENSDIATNDVRKTNFALELVKSKEELFDKIISSSKGEGSYLSLSASAKVDFVRERKWNYNSVYLWIKASRVTNKLKITKDNLLLREESQNLMQDSRFLFSEVCGDKFITETEMGGEIFGVIEVKTDSFQEKQTLETQVEAGGKFKIGSAKGSSEYKRVIEILKEKYNLDIKFLHIGGRILDVPQNEEGLLEVASQIEEITDAHPVAVGRITRDYTTVSNSVFDPNSSRVRERQDIVNTAEMKLKDSRSLFANGLYVLTNPKDFIMIGFDKEILQNELNQLEAYTWKLKRLRDSAYSFSEQVDKDILFQMPKVHLPKKKLWERNKPLNAKCEVRTSSLCGVSKYQTKESSYCGVKSPKTGTGPVCGATYKEGKAAECGVHTYKEARSEFCGVERFNQCHSSSCGKNWDGSRKRCRHSSCGVESYNLCRNKEHGVEEYNTCRSANFGIEKYETCANREFGFNFNSCEHFSHGPESFNACEVATIGQKETFCPNI